MMLKVGISHPRSWSSKMDSMQRSQQTILISRMKPRTGSQIPYNSFISKDELHRQTEVYPAGSWRECWLSSCGSEDQLARPKNLRNSHYSVTFPNRGVLLVQAPASATIAASVDGMPIRERFSGNRQAGRGQNTCHLCMLKVLLQFSCSVSESVRPVRKVHEFPLTR
jgi:hypothetical protein